MTRHDTAPPGREPGRATETTRYGSGMTAVAVDDTGFSLTRQGQNPVVANPREALWLKAAVVVLLAAIWERNPALGVGLGRLVLSCWPGFRRA